MKIRPLDWQKSGEGIWRRMQAQTAFGVVCLYAGGREIEWPLAFIGEFRCTAKSLKAAKAYVQQQHEARLRSFIEGGTDEDQTY